MLAGLAALGACGGEEPAIRVGEVGFTADELLGLSEQAELELKALAAFGQAVSEGREAEILAPLAEQDARAALAERILGVAAAPAEGEAGLREAYGVRPEPELTVRHLVVLSERWRPAEHRERARRAAEEALERVRSGEELAEVAADVSEEPGAAERGGLLEPGQEGSWVPEFWEAAVALEEGEVSDVVETEYGFHVIELERRAAAPFEDVRRRFEREAADVWQGRAAGWAAALGFGRGLSDEEVGSASLAALGSTAQAARIARAEVAALSPLLFESYPVETPAAD